MTLPDGRPVALRPVVASDRERLAEGFSELSAESRRLRFLGSVSVLSDAQLRYFTDVDGHDHVAWGVLDLADPERPGLGIGRFVRLREAPEVAEFSVTVLDTDQSSGVGTLLLAVLAVVAPTVGVRTLRGVVGRENDRMATWLRRLGATPRPGTDDLTLDLGVPVDPARNASATEFAAVCGQIRRALSAAS